MSKPIDGKWVFDKAEPPLAEGVQPPPPVVLNLKDGVLTFDSGINGSPVTMNGANEFIITEGLGGGSWVYKNNKFIIDTGFGVTMYMKREGGGIKKWWGLILLLLLLVFALVIGVKITYE